MTIESTADELPDILASDGLRAAVRHLNDRVPHRYTAVYQLDAAHARLLCIHDKNGEATPDILKLLPMGESFCQYALRDGYALIDNSLKDGRTLGNPNRGVMMAYHSVSLFSEEGFLFGTLCHLDVVERTLAPDELSYLQDAVRAFAPFLPSD